MVSLKRSTSSSPELLEAAVVSDSPVTGTRTPHSQLRQLSFGSPVARSLTRRPLGYISGLIRAGKKTNGLQSCLLYLPGWFREIGTSNISPSSALRAIWKAYWLWGFNKGNLDQTEWADCHRSEPSWRTLLCMRTSRWLWQSLKICPGNLGPYQYFELKQTVPPISWDRRPAARATASTVWEEGK